MPDCGQQCYCDGEDHDQEAPDDCTHWLDGECGGDDDDGHTQSEEKLMLTPVNDLQAKLDEMTADMLAVHSQRNEWREC